MESTSELKLGTVWPGGPVGIEEPAAAALPKFVMQQTQLQYARSAVANLFTVIENEQRDDEAGKAVKRRCADMIQFLSEEFPTLAIGKRAAANFEV
jgi:hypothetical protein